jgi:hypothetical protein
MDYEGLTGVPMLFAAGSSEVSMPLAAGRTGVPMLLAVGRTGVPMLLADGRGAAAAGAFLALTFLAFPFAALATFFAGVLAFFAAFLATFFLATFLAPFFATFLATVLRAAFLDLVLPLPVFFFAAMTANPSVDGLGYRITGAGFSDMRLFGQMRRRILCE